MKHRGKKDKRIKRKEDNLRDLWDNVKHPNIWIIGAPEEDKKKDHEKILEEITVENLITQVQETQSPKQDKPKVKHPKTHINKISKYKSRSKNIKSRKGKKNK